ncbi:hypothetical protein RGQ29_029670 [Quercus rubra]|uniref:Transmembrane protein n=1 Tax=Quercus rubra TaxID=3512 RepID=A0AAN7EFF3_QUERU|nr:hypothetical protein RGQ29_029670 [Quercus rubra]
MRSCTKMMASKKFITWGLLFILMFLLPSEAASRKVLETSELGNSKPKGVMAPPTAPTPGINFGVGYGNKQSRKSSTLEGNKMRGPAPPAGRNPGTRLPKTPPGSRT